MARVSVDQVALTDRRFQTMARILGTNRWEALGRMIAVWNECTERNTLHLTPEVIGDIHPDIPDLADVLIRSELAVEDSGSIRIRGAVGRTEWLEQKRNAAPAGGRARAATAQRGTNGQFLRGRGKSAEKPPIPAENTHQTGGKAAESPNRTVDGLDQPEPSRDASHGSRETPTPDEELSSRTSREPAGPTSAPAPTPKTKTTTRRGGEVVVNERKYGEAE